MKNKYSDGYQAGRKKGKADAIEELEWKYREQHLSKKDKAHIAMLPHVLANCNNWTIGDKNVSDAAGYSTLVKAFVKNLISPSGV